MALLAIALLPFLCCTSTVTPPPPPADPTTVFLLSEALHTGVVLPPDSADDRAGYVEFGFGDWSWYALGNEQWYNVFATVLWPTQGTLGRREFGSHTADEMRARVKWAELEPIVVSAGKVRALRKKLQAEFDARSAEAVERPELRFRFVPSDGSYWFPHNCADAAADWLRELDCTIGWAPIRKGLHVGKQ
jgi:hypothetical protein